MCVCVFVCFCFVLLSFLLSFWLRTRQYTYMYKYATTSNLFVCSFAQSISACVTKSSIQFKIPPVYQKKHAYLQECIKLISIAFVSIFIQHSYVRSTSVCIITWHSSLNVSMWRLLFNVTSDEHKKNHFCEFWMIDTLLLIGDTYRVYIWVDQKCTIGEFFKVNYKLNF